MIKTPLSERLITPTLLSQHINALIQIEPSFKNAYRQTSLPTLRLRNGGFLQLFQTIVSQQLSVSVANSIWQRLIDAGLNNEQAVLTAETDELRTQGLSKQKTRYVKSLAENCIDYEKLTHKSDEDVIKTLTQVTGIGLWSAEIYCLFSLNRCDIFAANDLALQAASQQLFSLSKRPKEQQMRTLAKAWSPHRSAAAYLLWAYYGVLKKRRGISV